jgi:large subunit ribosomal protein L29
MKSLSSSELRKNSTKKLNERILDLKREMMSLRFQKSSGQLTSLRSLNVIRREIARTKTILTELNLKKIGD